MPWLHYSDRPIMLDELFSSSQTENLSCYTKPNGFWITDDTEQSWLSWCLSERFNLDRLTHCTQVDLDEARILFLSSSFEIFDFTHRYGVAKYWGSNNQYIDHCVDWQKVAAEYSGNIITPYQWSCRLGDQRTRWYYGWDCASGCIWDSQAIRDIRLISIDLDVAEKARPEIVYGDEQVEEVAS